MQVGSERGEEYIKQRQIGGVWGREGRRSFHDRSFAGLDYWSNNMWHVPTTQTTK